MQLSSVHRSDEIEEIVDIKIVSIMRLLGTRELKADVDV